MNTELSFEQAKENLRDGLKYHYGSCLHEIENPEPVAYLEGKVVMDAYIGKDNNFRVSTYLLTDMLKEDEYEGIYRSVLQQLGKEPGRIIFIFYMPEQYDEWLDEVGQYLEGTERLWITQLDERSENALESQIEWMYDVLDGVIWRVGCCTGKDDRLVLLMNKEICPECGKTVWIPDYVLVTAGHDVSLDSKPWLLALNSIFKHSPSTVSQIADSYNVHEDVGGLMHYHGKYGFDITCKSCKAKVVEYDKPTWLYYQYELGPTWFRWNEFESLPDDVKLISIGNVSFDIKDVDLLVNETTLMDGVIFKGEHSIHEKVVKPVIKSKFKDLIEDMYAIERHLLKHPAFTADLKGSWAGLIVDHIYQACQGYAQLVFKVLHKKIEEDM